MSTESDIWPALSGTLLLASGTLVGYLAAFFYHREYVGVFGIPPELISVDPNSLLVAAGNVLNFVFAVGAFIVAARLVVSRPRTPVDIRLDRLMPPLVLAVIVLSLHLPPVGRNIVFLWLAYIVYREFVQPLVKYPHVKGYYQKLQTDDQERGTFGKIENKFFVPLVLVVLAFLVISLSSMAGRFTAVNIHRFLVLADQPDFIVPAFYADKVIAVRVDKKLRKVLPEIIVITRQSGKPLVFRWEEIGTLSPESER